MWAQNTATKSGVLVRRAETANSCLIVSLPVRHEVGEHVEDDSSVLHHLLLHYHLSEQPQQYYL
jgi:hypothetical protein